MPATRRSVAAKKGGGTLAPPGPLVWVHQGKVEHPAYVLEQTNREGGHVKVQWADRTDVATVNHSDIRWEKDDDDGKPRTRAHDHKTQESPKRSKRQTTAKRRQLPSTPTTTSTSPAVQKSVRTRRRERYRKRCRDKEDDDTESQLSRPPAKIQTRKSRRKSRSPRKSSAAAAATSEADIWKFDGDVQESRTISLQKPPSKHRRVTVSIDWPSSSDEDDDEHENGVHDAWKVKHTDDWEEGMPIVTPQQPKKRRAQSSSSRGKKHKQRRFWTDAEKKAVESGVKEYGEGNWKLIRSRSGGVLTSRTPVQIKDCYRTMEKAKERAAAKAAAETAFDEAAVAAEAAADGGDGEEATETPVSRVTVPVNVNELFTHIMTVPESPETPVAFDAEKPGDDEPKYLYPGQAVFDAALEVYNRSQHDGPNKLKRKGRVFVRRPVKDAVVHTKPCVDCGLGFKDDKDYVTEFRLWLGYKFCMGCMGRRLKKLVGTDQDEIKKHLKEVRAQQPFPVAGHLANYLHTMTLDDYNEHNKEREESEGPCMCSMCQDSCRCSYCWSQRTTLE